MFNQLAAWEESRAFEKIYVSFLPVGHTHNEPDQVASRISVACRNGDIVTMDDFVEVLKTCYRTEWASQLVVEQAWHAADTKVIIRPY